MASMQTITFTQQQHPWWRRWVDNVRSRWTGPLTSRSPGIARLFNAPPSRSGVFVDADSALSYSAVWAAVHLISSDCASLPLPLYERLPDGGRRRATEHRLYGILHDAPNSEMSAMVFREVLQAHVLLWGNAYCEIERDQLGRVSALWPLTPDRVQPFRDRRDPFGSLQYTVRNPDGTETRLQAMDVLHIPGLGYDGCSGYSVIAKARESIGLGLAMQQFGASFFGNGSTFGGVFTASRPLGPKEKADLETSLRHYHEGLDRAHRFMVLDGGLDYKRLGIPPDDAQFLESRKFQVAEIARLFNVPPHKLADLDRATFSNIESQQISYYQDTLRPWLVRWEQEINRKLLSPQEQGRLFAEHLIDGLLRGDAQGRAAFYTAMFGVGGITINEIRARENLNPIEGGDTVYLPADVVPIDRVGELPMATPEASARELPRQLVEFSVLSEDDKAARRRAEWQRENLGEQRRIAAEQEAVADLDKRRRRVAEIEREDADRERQAIRRLNAWDRRRRILNGIERKWPSVAHDIRESGWLNRTTPSPEDQQVKTLARTLGIPVSEAFYATR